MLIGTMMVRWKWVRVFSEKTQISRYLKYVNSRLVAWIYPRRWMIQPSGVITSKIFTQSFSHFHPLSQSFPFHFWLDWFCWENFHRKTNPIFPWRSWGFPVSIFPQKPIHSIFPPFFREKKEPSSNVPRSELISGTSKMSPPPTRCTLKAWNFLSPAPSTSGTWTWYPLVN